MKKNQLLQITFGVYTIYCAFGDLDPALSSLAKNLEESGDIDGPIIHSDGGMVIKMCYGDRSRVGTLIKNVEVPDYGYISEHEFSKVYR